MRTRIGAAASALAVGALAAGCGGSANGSDHERDEHATTARQAIAEIGAVRAGLDRALASYRSGDEVAAERQVGDTYLRHFELVEGPLDRVDHELKEQLEHGIRETLRDRMKDRPPVAVVARLVRRVEARLEQAKAALR